MNVFSNKGLDILISFKSPNFEKKIFAIKK